MKIHYIKDRNEKHKEKKGKLKLYNTKFYRINLRNIPWQKAENGIIHSKLDVFKSEIERKVK